jgi:hypothetical protein
MARRKKLRRLVLVTGNARSGTTTVSWLLRNVAQLDVPHEYCGEHGTVSCFFHTDHKWYPKHDFVNPKGRVCHQGERARDFEFQHVYHLVRHPVKSINSMSNGFIMTKQHRDWLIDTGVCPEDMKPKFRAMCHVVLNTNRICEALPNVQRIRLEDIAKWWPKMMRELGVNSKDAKLPNPIPVKNKRPFKPKREFTWLDVATKAPEVYEDLRKMAKSYGYKD